MRRATLILTYVGLGSLNSCDVTALALAPVENLSIVPVNSSSEILTKLNDGIRNHSIASTNMNETSRCAVVSGTFTY